jgi:hypothetical protein
LCHFSHWYIKLSFVIYSSISCLPYWLSYWLSYSGPLDLLFHNTFKLFGFPICWFWAYLMKVILQKAVVCTKLGFTYCRFLTNIEFKKCFVEYCKIKHFYFQDFFIFIFEYWLYIFSYWLSYWLPYWLSYWLSYSGPLDLLFHNTFKLFGFPIMFIYILKYGCPFFLLYIKKRVKYSTFQ